MPRPRHRLLNRKWLFLLSLFLILRTIAFVAGLVFFALGAHQQHIPYLYVAAGFLGLLLLLQLFQFMESSKVVCPNCRTQILTARHCSKHRDAKRLLGSYSLRLAIQVVFTDTFRCQYCISKYQWRGK